MASHNHHPSPLGWIVLTQLSALEQLLYRSEMVQDFFLSLACSSGHLKPEFQQMPHRPFCFSPHSLLLSAVPVLFLPQEAGRQGNLSPLLVEVWHSPLDSVPNFCAPYGSTDTRGQQFLGYAVWQQLTHRYSLPSSFPVDSCG